MTNTNRPYSPSPEYRYFLCDPNDGHTFYRTPEEREIAAKSLIEDYLVDGEWSKQVVDIYAGEATHLVSEVERIDKVGELDEDGYDENGEYWVDDDVDCKCNYDLRPLAPTLPANHFPDPTEMVAPPTEGEAELVAWLRETGRLLSRRPDIQCRVDLRLFDRAADMLQQQAAELAMPRQQAAPVPVSERLPDTSDPSECRMPFGDCWWFDPYQDGAWYMDTYQSRYTHWLPAHVLPLPSCEAINA